jgi:N-acetylmuramoyl-L-alanine amidase
MHKVWLLLLLGLLSCDDLEQDINEVSAIVESEKELQSVFFQKPIGQSLVRECNKMEEGLSSVLTEQYPGDWKTLCEINAEALASFDCKRFCFSSEIAKGFQLVEELEKQFTLTNSVVAKEVHKKHQIWQNEFSNECGTEDTILTKTCLAKEIENQLGWLWIEWNRMTSLTNTKCSSQPFLVAIDIGHSKNISGATSARGVTEYQFNLELSSKLLEETQRRGMDAFLIDPSGKDQTLSQRIQVASQRNPDVLISIHHDSAQPQYLQTWDVNGEARKYCDLFSGYSLFYSDRSKYPDKSLQVAHKIAQQLLLNEYSSTKHHAEKIKGENRELRFPKEGIYRWDNLGLLRRAKIPAVLFEAGVIINRSEELRLGSQIEQAVMASVIAEGLSKYCQDSQ